MPLLPAAGSRAFFVALAIAVASACSSSSETSITAPTSARCAVTLSGAASSVGASGGQGQIAIGISRECSWNARSESGWITLLSEAAGQGDGSVSYAVAANPSATPRRGSIVVNDSRLDLSQAAAACTFSLNSPGTTIDASGGTRTFNVAAEGTCSWTAGSSAPWLRVTTGASGSGNGAVSIAIAQNTSTETRTGQVTVGGATYAVTQLGATAGSPSPACAIVIEPATLDVSAQAGARSVRLTTSSAACAWSIVSSASWLSAQPVSGEGSTQVEIAFAANSSNIPRLGTLAAGDATVNVSQAAGAAGPDPGAPPPATPPTPPPGCSFAVASSNQPVAATGGEFAVSVTASDASCTWSASAGASWVTVSSGASATGSETARFAVAANSTTEQRSALVTVAGQSVTLVQQAGMAPPPTTPPPTSPPPTSPPAPAPCTFTVAPASLSFPSTGGERDIAVTASAASCTWTSTSDAAWLTIVEGATGTGSARVRVRAAEQTARAERRGTLTAAGQAVALVQDAAPAPPTTPPPPAPACTFSLAPTTQAAPAAGGAFQTALTASATTCSWAVTSNAAWLTLASAASGSGSTTVRYAVAANTATSTRTGTLTVNGQTLTVTQAAAAPPPAPVCTFTVAPTSVSVPETGGSRTTRVTASAGTCGWTARSNASWLTVTAGASGTGSGDVGFSADINLTPDSRSGTLTVAGQTVTVTQAAFQVTTIDGEISSFSGSCPNLTFVVNGRTVETSSATTFANGNCNSLRNGREVRVFGLVRPGNRIFAITVTRDDD